MRKIIKKWEKELSTEKFEAALKNAIDVVQFTYPVLEDSSKHVKCEIFFRNGTTYNVILDCFEDERLVFLKENELIRFKKILKYYLRDVLNQIYQRIIKL